MTNDAQQVPVTLSDETMTELTAYCEFFGLERNQLIEKVLTHFFVDQKATDFSLLMKGYTDMSQLNEEIADEFCATEAEAATLDR
ncbi:hypothetical protein ACRYI5_05615 [Furfurilactobacillus sp. WILCCON 0119]|uniref:hypothetical protein n=1 Tax=Furfurilactobacillus entadae TaxID=2922307 RepID=UPI0035E84604